MGHLKITFSNTNVKNVVNTMLSSLKEIKQSISTEKPKNQTSNESTLRPWNRLSENYCNRRNKSRMGLCRGCVWFCSICKNNMVQFSCGRQVIIHNFYNTTPKGGQFHYCSTCKRLMLYYV